MPRTDQAPLVFSLPWPPSALSPNARRHDRDNLLARMKAGIDGVCDALGIDDSRFAAVTVQAGAVTRPDGCVWVRIAKAAG